MKTTKITLLALAIHFPTNAYSENNKSSFGIGAGSMYSGLGVNYGIKADRTFKYLSFGTYLLAYGTGNGLYSNFGLGVGYMTTTFSQNDKHAVGVDGSVSYSRPDYRSEGMSYKGSASYIYFFNNMAQGGWHAGLTLGVEYYENNLNLIGPIHIGYQF